MDFTENTQDGLESNFVDFGLEFGDLGGGIGQYLEVSNLHDVGGSEDSAEGLGRSNSTRLIDER